MPSPEELLDQLQRDLVGAIDSPEVRERIATLGFELTPSTPQQLRARAEGDLALYTLLLRDGRLTKV